ncbi:hypothetical protein MKZ38_005643 [Zalerion maritima]|uniref:Uncharacterized protein n=1 Tax=Zalerion maritima TaxID=339359 RepID=A0AAD5RW03_9PEZI|nr:hypothetical protein MKZ38_005643 [Zalerion maritima]
MKRGDKLPGWLKKKRDESKVGPLSNGKEVRVGLEGGVVGSDRYIMEALSWMGHKGFVRAAKEWMKRVTANAALAYMRALDEREKMFGNKKEKGIDDPVKETQTPIKIEASIMPEDTKPI